MGSSPGPGRGSPVHPNAEQQKSDEGNDAIEIGEKTTTKNQRPRKRQKNNDVESDERNDVEIEKNDDVKIDENTMTSKVTKVVFFRHFRRSRFLSLSTSFFSSLSFAVFFIAFGIVVSTFFRHFRRRRFLSPFSSSLSISWFLLSFVTFDVNEFSSLPSSSFFRCFWSI